MTRRIRDIDLMQLADGELDPAARATVERQVTELPDAAGKVAAIEELGELVRGHLELAADEAEPRFASMWAQIDKRLDLDSPAVQVPARTPTVPAPEPGLWGRVGRWIDSYRGHVLTGALSAGAVAAIALVMRPADDEPKEAPAQIAERDTTPQPQITPPVPQPQPPVAEVQTVQHTPVEVQSLEVSGGASTIVTYDDEDGEKTTVIWITPDDTVEGI